jgi:hypothetical protein
MLSGREAKTTSAKHICGDLVVCLIIGIIFVVNKSHLDVQLNIKYHEIEFKTSIYLNVLDLAGKFCFSFLSGNQLY